MTLTVKTDPTAPYRAGVAAQDTADLAALVASVFTRASPVPVISVAGAPNVAVSARLAAPGHTLGVTPVLLRLDPNGTLTVLGVADEVTLEKGAVASGDGTKTYSRVEPLSALGSRGSAPGGSGPVTHVAFLCSTAPAGAADLYAWSWA